MRMEKGYTGMGRERELISGEKQGYMRMGKTKLRLICGLLSSLLHYFTCN